MTFREFGGEKTGVSGAMLDRIAHISLRLGASMQMGSDVTRPDDFKTGSNNYIAVEAESVDEAERVFKGLADGGGLKPAAAMPQWMPLRQ